MFFDIAYIEQICSPDILIVDRYKSPYSDDIVSIDKAVSRLEDQGYRYEFEERAAILEYGGGLRRNHAERQAIHEITHRMIIDNTSGRQ